MGAELPCFSQLKRKNDEVYILPAVAGGSDLSEKELDRFSRQVMLEQIGYDGQLKFYYFNFNLPHPTKQWKSVGRYKLHKYKHYVKTNFKNTNPESLRIAYLSSQIISDEVVIKEREK